MVSMNNVTTREKLAIFGGPKTIQTTFKRYNPFGDGVVEGVEGCGFLLYIEGGENREENNEKGVRKNIH